MRNQALPGKIYDANNGLTYALHGDYYLPLIEAPQDGRPIGKYGRMRMKYLKEHHPVLYNQLVFTGKLQEHLIEVNECCIRMKQMLVTSTAAWRNSSFQSMFTANENVSTMRIVSN